jgi:hypothetical protein
MSFLKVFNQKLVEFIKDLLILFPDDQELKKAKMGLDMIIPANPRVTLNFFKKSVLPNKEIILSRNMEEFVRKGREELGEHLGYIFDKVNVQFQEMSETNQENVMKYCKLLIMLAEKC